VPKAEPEDAVIEHADAKILVDSEIGIAKIAKPTGSKLVKGPAESEKFVRWKSMKNSEENS
jgi:hypothetical protein